MTQSQPHPNRRAELWAGAGDTFPLIVGTIPFGIIFGAVAVTSGVSLGGAMAMSAFVFAGSAQFIAPGLSGGSAGGLVIVVTTLVVNLRHALYAASLAPHMKHLPQRWLAPLGFWLTDKSYVVVVSRYSRPDGSPHKHWYHLGSALFMYANWQLCTWIGLIAGQSIPNPRAWGLDFALVVTFIGMLAQFIHNKPALAAAGGRALRRFWREDGARPVGVREALIHIDGFGAYALLKGETGSHRLTMAAPGTRNAACEVKVETRPMRKPASLAERLTRSATITLLKRLTGRVIVWRNDLAPEGDRAAGGALRYNRRRHG